MTPSWSKSRAAVAHPVLEQDLGAAGGALVGEACRNDDEAVVGGVAAGVVTAHRCGGVQLRQRLLPAAEQRAGRVAGDHVARDCVGRDPRQRAVGGQQALVAVVRRDRHRRIARMVGVGAQLRDGRGMVSEDRE